MSEFKIEAKKTEVFMHEEKEENFKMLRLVETETDGANVTLEFTSQDESGLHKLFNEFVDHDIEIVIRKKK